MHPARHVLVLFLDGVGLGQDDPARNPFCTARMPVLAGLLGAGWYLSRQPIAAVRASLYPTDAVLGVPGRPQSATGQATLLTGRNVPEQVGSHFGPLPTGQIAAIVKNGNLFSRVRACGGKVGLLNPYPQRFFDAVESGRRLLSVIQLAALSAGSLLMTQDDLMAGRAVSPDFTGEAWRIRLNVPQIPLLTPHEAGHRLVGLARRHSLAFFDHWPTDLVGHRQDICGAIDLLERLDSVLAGIVECWDWENGAVLITSDHGNLEDMSVRSHTLNPVPTIWIGCGINRSVSCVRSLVDIAPTVMRFLS